METSNGMNTAEAITSTAEKIGLIGTQLDLLSNILVNSLGGMEALEEEAVGIMLHDIAARAHGLYSILYDIGSEIKKKEVVAA